MFSGHRGHADDARLHLLHPVFDQLRRQDRLRLPGRVGGVDGKGVGLVEDVRFVLSDDAVDFLVRRMTIMRLGAAEQKQCAREDREETPGHDGPSALAWFSGLSFTH